MQNQLSYAVSLSDFVPAFTKADTTAIHRFCSVVANLPQHWGYNCTLAVLKSTTRPNFSTKL